MKTHAEQTQPVPVRLSLKTINDVKAAAKHLPARSDQEVVRMALEIGLAVLSEVDYDVAGIVARFALGNGTAAAEQSGSRAEQMRLAQQELHARKAASRPSSASSGTRASA